MQPEYAVVHSAVIVRGNGMRINCYIMDIHLPLSVVRDDRVSGIKLWALHNGLFYLQYLPCTC